MKYAVRFCIFGMILAAVGACLGGPAWLLLWPAVSLVLIGGAYAGLGPRVCGKQPDGRMAWWAVLALLPYLLTTWIGWHAIRRLSREACCDEVCPACGSADGLCPATCRRAGARLPRPCSSSI